MANVRFGVFALLFSSKSPTEMIDRFDWTVTIEKNIMMLRLAGLWPAGNEDYKFDFYTFYAAACLTCFIFGHNFFQSFNIIFILDDLEALTATIFVSLTELLAILKSYYLIRNMKLVKQLMITLNSDMFQPKNGRQRRLIAPNLRSWQLVYRLFTTLASSALFFWATFPILDGSVKQHRLPFLSWYPFNSSVSPYYEITYAYQMVSTFIIAMVNLNIDTFIAALNMYIRAQCIILCDDLKHLNVGKNNRIDEVDNALILSITHHKAIVRFAQDSNKFYNGIVLAQFFTSAVTIAMTLFNLTLVTLFTSEFYSLIFYGNAVIVQIFMYCWFGNNIEIESSEIPYAVFESNWTEMPIKVKKNIVFFITRCQRPIRVSAFKLFYLSLDTFVRILRTSWSYFAVLRQVQEF